MKVPIYLSDEIHSTMPARWHGWTPAFPGTWFAAKTEDEILQAVMRKWRERRETLKRELLRGVA